MAVVTRMYNPLCKKKNAVPDSAGKDRFLPDYAGLCRIVPLYAALCRNMPVSLKHCTPNNSEKIE
ncbi:hypothetical protein [Chitinophaga skermanii]|uniref:hypothetical protein n=1 Tax=Chitinophaga skermanii TaxID=331697 RepID=UPI0011E58F3D|nr:hypothetical protein [Chitinophaga skermanii]